MTSHLTTAVERAQFEEELKPLPPQKHNEAETYIDELKSDPDFIRFVTELDGTRKPPLTLGFQRNLLDALHKSSSKGYFYGKYQLAYYNCARELKDRGKLISKRGIGWHSSFVAEILTILYLLSREWDKVKSSFKRNLPITRQSPKYGIHSIRTHIGTRLRFLEINKQNLEKKKHRNIYCESRAVRLQDSVDFDRSRMEPGKCPLCNHESLMVIETEDEILRANLRNKKRYEVRKENFEEQESPTIKVKKKRSNTTTKKQAKPRKPSPYSPRVACFCCKLNCLCSSDGNGCYVCVALVKRNGFGANVTAGKGCLCEICMCPCEVDFNLYQRAEVLKVVESRKKVKEIVSAGETVSSPEEFKASVGNHLIQACGFASKDSSKSVSDAYDMASISLLNDKEIRHNTEMQMAVGNSLGRPSLLPNGKDIDEYRNKDHNPDWLDTKMPAVSPFHPSTPQSKRFQNNGLQEVDENNNNNALTYSYAGTNINHPINIDTNEDYEYDGQQFINDFDQRFHENSSSNRRNNVGRNNGNSNNTLKSPPSYSLNNNASDESPTPITTNKKLRNGNIQNYFVKKSVLDTYLINNNNNSNNVSPSPTKAHNNNTNKNNDNHNNSNNNNENVNHSNNNNVNVRENNNNNVSSMELLMRGSNHRSRVQIIAKEVMDRLFTVAYSNGADWEETMPFYYRAMRLYYLFVQGEHNDKINELIADSLILGLDPSSTLYRIQIKFQKHIDDY